MFRGNFIPLALVSVCGVLTAVATLQPELQKQTEETRTITASEHARLPQSPVVGGRSVSTEMAKDFEAAKAEFQSAMDKPQGFAWGIRQALFGQKDNTTQREKSTPTE